MTTRAASSSGVLIRGARVFDGTSEQLVEGKDIRVQDGKIAGFASGIAPRIGWRASRSLAGHLTRTRTIFKEG